MVLKKQLYIITLGLSRYQIKKKLRLSHLSKNWAVIASTKLNRRTCLKASLKTQAGLISIHVIAIG